MARVDHVHEGFGSLWGPQEQAEPCLEGIRSLGAVEIAQVMSGSEREVRGL